MIRGWDGSIDDIAGTDLVILPIGSIEQHGHHLPVITDWAIASAIGKGVAEKTGGFYIPALPVSTNKEQRGKRGSVGMHSDTFYRMVTDICLDLKAQGFKRVAIVQGHGGIFVMNPVVRELNADHNPELFIAKLDIETCWAKFQVEGLLDSPVGVHAEEVETSLMLYLHPELVDMEKAVVFYPSVPRSFLNYGGILRYCPDGVWGDATKGSAEKGKKMFVIAVETLVHEMNNLFDMMSKKQPLNGSWF
jgi:creatinine amidohydrolase